MLYDLLVALAVTLSLFCGFVFEGEGDFGGEVDWRAGRYYEDVTSSVMISDEPTTPALTPIPPML